MQPFFSTAIWFHAKAQRGEEAKELFLAETQRKQGQETGDRRTVTSDKYKVTKIK